MSPRTSSMCIACHKMKPRASRCDDCQAFAVQVSLERRRGDEVPGWFGPCAHGRDPYDRCDLCGEMSGWAAKELAEVVARIRKWRADGLTMELPEFGP